MKYYSLYSENLESWTIIQNGLEIFIENFNGKSKNLENSNKNK